MKRLEMMKDQLVSCVEGQMANLSNADSKELGEAVDMIKDLEEAIYYASITKAMEDNKEEYYSNPKKYYKIWRNDEEYMPYENHNIDRMYYRDGMHIYPAYSRDYREGRSGEYRRNYLETREMHKGKDKQMKELENYMYELTEDIMDMINEATPEEKQMLSQKLSTLADKVK